MSNDFEDYEEELSEPEGFENDTDCAEITDCWAGLENVTVRPDDEVGRQKLKGMFQSWFIEYASYVILDRSVPAIEDGLKPVQRRILHTLKTMDDGHLTKVANIVGETMKYHPHGDASIYDALVNLGQKNLLVDTQGNWGNPLTGAPAAAGRYIEARLSPFAIETLYSPKVTEWTPSYDGRKNEPVTLPTKFPLLLMQGVEGIAVGLSSKILPHNFNEILDAAVAYLKGEEFTLLPDLPTGGFIDVSRYNDGKRGGSVKIRAKIEKIDNKTLAITELPFGSTSGSLIASILKAFETGKIKIRKVDDNTASTANVIVHLLPGTSSDKTIDALYAFTNCEVSISPNCCVIADRKPQFMGVSDVLRYSVDHTRDILRRELEIRRAEVSEQLYFTSLEKIFISIERMYKDKEYEQSKSREEAVAHITRRFDPWKPKLLRELTEDDINRLLEIKMVRIIRYNTDKADEAIANYEEQIRRIDYDLAHLTEFTIDWYESLRQKYGAERQRKTVIRGFDSIEATKVVEANEKLYINREEGFIGTGLKKDEPVCPCSSLDDIIVFYRDGRYKVVKVQDKLFVGKNVLHLAVFKRNDTRTVYNLIYQNGPAGSPSYMKRFCVTGITRDREYSMIPGEPKSKILYFSANPNGEAETVRVTLKPKPRLNKLQIDIDFAQLAIKGRGALGNLVTKNDIARVNLKERGVSTLGGIQVWFDPDVLRLNNEGRGQLLGEFQGSDKVLIVLKNGEYYTSTFETSNHYEDNILRIEKFRQGHVMTAVLFDAEQGYYYMKRFAFEPSAKRQRFIAEHAASRLVALSDAPGARIRIVFNGADEMREPLEVTAFDFIGVKSFKAKGKRLTTYSVGSITEIEPVEVEEQPVEIEPEAPSEEPIADAPIEKSDDEVRDELTGQQRFF